MGERMIDHFRELRPSGRVDALTLTDADHRAALWLADVLKALSLAKYRKPLAS